MRLVLSAGQTATGVRLPRDIVTEQFSSKMVQCSSTRPSFGFTSLDVIGVPFTFASGWPPGSG